jgi:hypothetical protein
MSTSRTNPTYVRQDPRRTCRWRSFRCEIGLWQSRSFAPLELDCHTVLPCAVDVLLRPGLGRQDDDYVRQVPTLAARGMCLVQYATNLTKLLPRANFPCMRLNNHIALRPTGVRGDAWSR